MTPAQRLLLYTLLLCGLLQHQSEITSQIIAQTWTTLDS